MSGLHINSLSASLLPLRGSTRVVSTATERPESFHPTEPLPLWFGDTFHGVLLKTCSRLTDDTRVKRLGSASISVSGVFVSLQDGSSKG